MFVDRTTPEYQNGVDLFLKHCLSCSSDSNFVKCPCLSCGNTKSMDVRQIREHLICNGIDQSYDVWIYHGESCPIAKRSYLDETVEDQGLAVSGDEDDPSDFDGTYVS